MRCFKISFHKLSRRKWPHACFLCTHSAQLSPLICTTVSVIKTRGSRVGCGLWSYLISAFLSFSLFLNLVLLSPFLIIISHKFSCLNSDSFLSHSFFFLVVSTGQYKLYFTPQVRLYHLHLPICLKVIFFSQKCLKHALYCLSWDNQGHSLVLAPSKQRLSSLLSFLKITTGCRPLFCWTQLFTLLLHHSLILKKKKKALWLTQEEIIMCGVIHSLLRHNGIYLHAGWGHALCYYVTPYVFLVDAFHMHTQSSTLTWLKLKNFSVWLHDVHRTVLSPASDPFEFMQKGNAGNDSLWHRIGLLCLTFFHFLNNIQWHKNRNSRVLKLTMCGWVLIAPCVDLCLLQYWQALESKKSWRKCMADELGLLIWAVLFRIERAERWTGGEMALMKGKGMYHFSSNISGTLHSALADWLPGGH